MLKNISLFFLLLGIALAFFGGGLPIRGFVVNKKLANEYLVSKSKGENPSLDQKGAYYTVLCYRYGAFLILLSFVFYVFSLI